MWNGALGSTISTRRILPCSMRNASVKRMLEGRLNPLNVNGRPSDRTPELTVP